MEWIDYPKDVEVKTEMGKLYLSITDATHAYASTEPHAYNHPDHGGKNRLTYRGASVYGLSFHAVYVAGSGWTLYQDKVWEMGFDKYATPAFMKEFMKKCFPFVAEFLESPAASVLKRKAQIAHVNNEKMSIEKKILELKEELAKEETKIRELVGTLSAYEQTLIS